MFWRLACVRGLLGFMTIWAIRIVFIENDLNTNRIYASTDESWRLMTIMLPYFIFEEGSLLYFDYRFKTFSKELHLHHILAFIGFYFNCYCHTQHFYGLKIFILEMSTPFSCICFCLLKLRMERTLAWKINQLILIYVFHFRTVLELMIWYDIYNDWSYFKEHSPFLQMANVLIGLIALTFWLTPYWTYKKTAQFFHPVDWDLQKNTEKQLLRKKEDSKEN
ncbi:unnamed protein product [Didymodactylos carnosus]|nr:unnamed protein product [Didymodactylos carnosus]CAF4321221.1 unnamed protein product [Didymodactylos carnosus]